MNADVSYIHVCNVYVFPDVSDLSLFCIVYSVQQWTIYVIFHLDRPIHKLRHDNSFESFLDSVCVIYAPRCKCLNPIFSWDVKWRRPWRHYILLLWCLY